MTTQNTNTREETQIRKRVDEWAKAVRAKDVDKVISNYARDLGSFDILPPLQYKGAAASRKTFEEWFRTFEGPVGYEIRELSVTTSGDVAFSHSLNRISGKRTNGEDTDTWVRLTVGYRKIDGRWLVTHEHVSVPFDMETGQASVDLKP